MSDAEHITESALHLNAIVDIEDLEMLKAKVLALPGCSRLTDGQVELIYGMGYVAYSQGKLDIACGVFQSLMVYRPLDVRILTAFGVCCKRLGRFQHAIVAFASLATLEPGIPAHVMHLAECSLALGKHDDALRLLDSVEQLCLLHEGFSSVLKRACAVREIIRLSSVPAQSMNESVS